MNDLNAINLQNLMSTFPEALQQDKRLVAFAQVAAQALVERRDEINRIIIYANIDNLPEDLLDILARDFKVDWYDQDYTLAEKRQIIKDSFRVHRMMGSKAAVETAIRAVYPDTEVKEWFEYEGEPYHFRLLINSTFETVDQQRHQRVMEKVNFYKPLRAVMDEVEYRDAGAVAGVFVATACVGNELVDGAVAVRY